MDTKRLLLPTLFVLTSCAPQGTYAPGDRVSRVKLASDFDGTIVRLSSRPAKGCSYFNRSPEFVSRAELELETALLRAGFSLVKGNAFDFQEEFILSIDCPREVERQRLAPLAEGGGAARFEMSLRLGGTQTLTSHSKEVSTDALAYMATTLANKVAMNSSWMLRNLQWRGPGYTPTKNKPLENTLPGGALDLVVRASDCDSSGKSKSMSLDIEENARPLLLEAGFDIQPGSRRFEISANCVARGSKTKNDGTTKQRWAYNLRIGEEAKDTIVVIDGEPKADIAEALARNALSVASNYLELISEEPTKNSVSPLAQRKPLPLCKPTKIVVLPAASGDEKNVPADFDANLALSFAKSSNLHAITERDLKSVVDIELRKDELGCSSVRCMTEIAAALDAQYVAHSLLSKPDAGTYTVYLSLTDTKEIKILRATSRVTPGASLIVATDDAVHQLTQQLRGSDCER